MNRDFAEMLSALFEAGAEFLVRLRFEEAWTRRIVLDIEGVSVPVLGRDDFVTNKRASGRPKDRLDLELLGN